MVGHDLGVVEIEWGGVRLHLRYPLGAVKTLSESLGGETEIYELPQLLKKLELSTLGIWVYCGLLHERHGSQPKHSDLSQKDIIEFVEWSKSPLLPLIRAVNQSFMLSIFGSMPVEEEDETPTPKDRRKDGRGRRLVFSLFNIFKRRRETFGGSGISPLSVTQSKLLKAVK